ncbi:hypothetical protein O6H91_13G014300 [Diphasiastrum complanatum]|uniref:Uncharacterized protein n=8 Tax=Diphasiastrum complanatum TaxID=34168 RepID=A0ACC2BSD3_DIPCM|nr:hypothetical protein O6H91_13G014300 [Diphasiastrum complanatum]KAJ7532680.1 hypothetical protein O6H91_13G014300 [Diphasiastrum complanatum]KAJ7532681.1 hypothetical protein O6H91_13G014300 [Diphasiastrum complanatum]
MEVMASEAEAEVETLVEADAEIGAGAEAEAEVETLVEADAEIGAGAEAEAEAETLVVSGCENVEGRSVSKMGWEAAQAWLMAIPRRRNVTRHEIDEWLQQNKSSLSNEVASVPRLHMYRYMEAQHKLIRRADQANDAQPPQLLEPPLRRFKRSDKWKPVWLWLEKLDQDKVVRANDISRWLLANPDLTAELRATHSRDHLLRYIQKCHHIVLKKKKKLGYTKKEKAEKGSQRQSTYLSEQVVSKESLKNNPRSSTSTRDSQARNAIHMEGGWLRAMPEQGDRESQMQDLKEQKARSAFLYTSQDEVQNLRGIPPSMMKTGELHPLNVSTTMMSWPSSSLGIKVDQQSESGIEVRPGISQPNQPLMPAQEGMLECSGAERKPGCSGAEPMSEKDLAIKKYELLSDLQTLLEDLLRKSYGRQIQYTPIDIAHAQEEQLIFSSIENSTRHLSVNSRRVRSRRRRSHSSSLAVDAHHVVSPGLDPKRRRIEKGVSEKSIYSWTFQEALEGSGANIITSYNFAKRRRAARATTTISATRFAIPSEIATSQNSEEPMISETTINVAKCMQEREVGGALGSVACRFKNVGSHNRNWASVLRGWDSLDRHFPGPAVTLEQKAYSSWAPSWCAYTSNVAIVQPSGRMDQGIQKVLDVRFHPGGLPQLVCSCNAAPNELLLYSLVNGRARELSGHNCQIQAVEYAVGGSLIVSCASNLVKVWDSSTAACLHTLGSEHPEDNVLGHRKKISALAVNPSQSCLVATSGGKGDAQLLLWNVLTGALISNLNSSLREREPNVPPMDAIDFCSNHQNLLICGSDAANGGPAVVQLWDVDALKDCTTFAANESYITCLKTDRAGHMLLTGSGDGSIGLFDIRTCGAITRLPLGLNCEVTSVSFSSCGTYFQGSSTANKTMVWDTRMMSMEPGTTSLEHPPQLAKSDSRSTRALHCLSHGKPMPTAENACQLPGFVDEGDQGVNDARWFQNSPILVTASGNGSIAMWDMSLAQPCIRHMKSHSRCINSVAVAPDDLYICSGGDDQKVVIYQDVGRETRQQWRLTHPLCEKLRFATRLDDS